jgi:ankyrin repeat protein
MKKLLFVPIAAMLITFPSYSAQEDLNSKLSQASRSGDVVAVQKVIAAGVNVNAKFKNKNGVTALIEAAGNGHNVVVQRLIKAGVDVNTNPNVSSHPFYRNIQAILQKI